MCPSCETNPIDQDGVCRECRAMYIEQLGPNWKDTEAGQFLLSSNRQTAQMNARIAHEPTGYDIECIAGDVGAGEGALPVPAPSTEVDEMIAALVLNHGWGYRRIHAFLETGGYSPPSLSSVKRRVTKVREEATTSDLQV